MKKIKTNLSGDFFIPGRKCLRIMKLTFIFMLWGLMSFASATYSQSTRLTFESNEATIESVFRQIESLSEFKFAYNSSKLNVGQKISVKADHETIDVILDKILGSTDFHYKIVDRYIIINDENWKNPTTLGSEQAARTVKGKVTDVSGATLPGVSVVVKGTTTGVITDTNGDYLLSNISENAVVQFSFVGMKTQEVAVGGKTTINVTLAEETVGIEEVVAVGYGVQQKKVLTGSTTQLKGNDLQKLNTVSAMNALQGITPGVSITKTDAQPGDGTKVYIRGIGTINNSDPLYVVDGNVVANIDYLSPTDIESIDVLKDATGAIYGSRAANGVVLVTTQKGKRSQKTSISYDGYYGVQNVYKKEQTLNAQQYLAIMQEERVNSGLLPFTNDYFIQNVPDGQGILNGTNKGTNWLDAITNNNAPIQSHALNITGGSEKSTYSIGLSYLSQDGILGAPVASNYNRYNFRINSDHDLIGNKEMTILKVGETLNYDYSEKSGIAIGDGFYNDISNCINATPFMPIYDKSGNYSSVLLGWDSSGTNPIGQMVDRGGFNLQKSHHLIGNIFSEVQPLKNLIWRSSFGYNIYAGSYRSYSPAYDFGPRSIGPYDITSQSMTLGIGWTWDNTVSYKYSFSKHNFSILAGTSAQRSGLGESITGSNGGSIFNSFQYAYLSNDPVIYNNGETRLTGSPWGKSGIFSYFGRFNYDYKGTYLLQGIVRADGSSNFGLGHRWGTFPAFSAGWVMTNESFMKTVNWLDFLKIRGSWGKNGNQAISPFQYLTTISSGAEYFYGLDKVTPAIGAYPSIVPNPNVTWETSEQTDIGFDANLLTNRLTLTFDYYNKITKNWLVEAPLQEVYGTNPPYINGGDIDNRGYEIAAGWRDHIGKLKYNINANVAYNHNRVTRIDNSEGIIEGQSGFYGINDVWYRAQVGYPIGYFYGYKTDGIFQTEAEILAYKDKNGQLIQPSAVPGDVKFIDLNGNGVIDSKDRTQIGDPHPHYTYGVMANLEYAGFDFSVTGVGVGGNKVADAMDFSSIMDLYSNYTAAVLDRWHGPGTSNSYPRVVSGANINTQYFSDLYMKSGAYFRISNVTLGYDFKKLIPTIPLQQIRFYATIQNLYTFTKYPGVDPEVGYAPDNWAQGIDIGNYPSPRTVMVGASIKF